MNCIVNTVVKELAKVLGHRHLCYTNLHSVQLMFRVCGYAAR